MPPAPPPDHSWHLARNVAAISARFHTHRLCGSFCRLFHGLVDGDHVAYEICVEMAETLTRWQAENGGMLAYDARGVTWIKVVEDYVDAVLCEAVRNNSLDRLGPLLFSLPALRP